MFQLHITIPKVDDTGELIFRIKRVLDFACIPALAIFLCDHRRDATLLFSKLKREFFHTSILHYK